MLKELLMDLLIASNKLIFSSLLDCQFLQGSNTFFFFLAFFLGPHMRHMEVPRLGTELEL